MKLVLERIKTADQQVYETEYFWGKDLSIILSHLQNAGCTVYHRV